MNQPAEKAPAEDPSMEDILASIRRILNDDEAPGEAHAADAGDPPAGPPATESPAGAGAAESPAGAPAPESDVFVLDQTMLIEEPAHVAVDEPFGQEHLAPEQAAPPRQAAGPDEPLLAPTTEAAASASMGALVRVLGQQQMPVYRGGPTLEDMVRDEIRKLVKSWLDENLPPMVERLVRAEIARVTGGK